MMMSPETMIVVIYFSGLAAGLVAIGAASAIQSMEDEETYCGSVVFVLIWPFSVGLLVLTGFGFLLTKAILLICQWGKNS